VKNPQGGFSDIKVIFGYQEKGASEKLIVLNIESIFDHTTMLLEILFVFFLLLPIIGVCIHDPAYMIVVFSCVFIFFGCILWLMNQVAKYVYLVLLLQTLMCHAARKKIPPDSHTITKHAFHVGEYPRNCITKRYTMQNHSM
jgi:hypothetical protein